MANKWIVLVAVAFTAISMGAPQVTRASKTTKTNKPVKAATAKPEATQTAPVEMAAPASVAPLKESVTITAPAAEQESVAGAGPSSTEATVQAPSAAKMVGSFEIRPSISTLGPDEYHTENEITLGVQFNPNTNLVYYQYFNTNLYNPNPTSSALNFAEKDGFFRGKINNILSDASGNSFSYEGRIYTPVDPRSRDKGFITALRTYLKFSHKFNNAFTLTAMEVPIVFAHSKSGFNGSANPVFENRVYLVGSISFTDNLYLDLPIWFSQTRLRNYQAGAPRNNDWSYGVYVYPELTYLVNPNLALGIAYYNDGSLVNADLSGTSIGSGLDVGTTQLIIRASL